MEDNNNCFGVEYMLFYKCKDCPVKNSCYNKMYNKRILSNKLNLKNIKFIKTKEIPISKNGR